jgi:hypothetical protein
MSVAGDGGGEAINPRLVGINAQRPGRYAGSFAYASMTCSFRQIWIKKEPHCRAMAYPFMAGKNGLPIK